MGFMPSIRSVGKRGVSNPRHNSRHVRRAEQAGLMRKIGWLGGWVAMTPEVSVSLFRRPFRVMTLSCQVMTLVSLPHNRGEG
jgi:hypothetical protein